MWEVSGSGPGRHSGYKSGDLLYTVYKDDSVDLISIKDPGTWGSVLTALYN